MTLGKQQQGIVGYSLRCLCGGTMPALCFKVSRGIFLIHSHCWLSADLVCVAQSHRPPDGIPGRMNPYESKREDLHFFRVMWVPCWADWQHDLKGLQLFFFLYSHTCGYFMKAWCTNTKHGVDFKQFSSTIYRICLFSSQFSCIPTSS